MTAKERILTIRLYEKIKQHPEYSSYIKISMLSEEKNAVTAQCQKDVSKQKVI